MLGSLPPELFLLVLSHLTLNDIANAHLVCSEWHSIIKQNAETVYLHAALFHAYLTSPLLPLTTNTDADSANETTYSFLNSCKKQRRIERSWRGYAPSYSSYLTSPTSFVHRFKVDEKDNLLICSHKRGDIKVWCSRSSPLPVESPLSSSAWTPVADSTSQRRPLFHLEGVRAYAHVEYSNGFLLFDSEGGKEVWRHSTEVPTDQALPLHAPTGRPYEGIRQRGVFARWATLASPEPTRAFRFVYPTLLAASEHNLYLWDIPTARLATTIHNIQGGEDGAAHLLGRLTYVELSTTHVFVAGVHGLMGLERPEPRKEHANAEDCKVLYLSSEPIAYRRIGAPSLKIVNHLPLPERQENENGEHLVRPLQLESGNPLKASYEEFTAVHVDPTTTTLVALLRHARLLIVSNPCSQSRRREGEEREVIRYSRTFQDIQLGPTRSISKYMAFENGRVAVATTRGVFIVHLPRYSPVDPNIKLSDLGVSYLPMLGVRKGLKLVTCLQLTKDALWINRMVNGRESRPSWMFDEDDEEYDDREIEEDEEETDEEDEANMDGVVHHAEPSMVCRVSFNNEAH